MDSHSGLEGVNIFAEICVYFIVIVTMNEVISSFLFVRFD